MFLHCSSAATAARTLHTNQSNRMYFFCSLQFMFTLAWNGFEFKYIIRTTAHNLCYDDSSNMSMLDEIENVRLTPVLQHVYLRIFFFWCFYDRSQNYQYFFSLLIKKLIANTFLRSLFIGSWPHGVGSWPHAKLLSIKFRKRFFSLTPKYVNLSRFSSKIFRI